MKIYHFKLVFRPATITDFNCREVNDADPYFKEKRVDQGPASPHVQMDFIWWAADCEQPAFAICEEYGLDPDKIAETCRQMSNAMDERGDTA